MKKRPFETFSWFTPAFSSKQYGWAWSSDWLSFHPWSVNGAPMSYFSRRHFNNGTTTCNLYFAGPLCIQVHKPIEEAWG